MKKIEKKIRRNQFAKLQPNQNFYDFYSAIHKYFETHHMQECRIEMRHESALYLFNDNIKESEKAIKVFDKMICNITFLPHKDGIELYRFEMYKPGTGFGSIFMNAFTNISKQLGIDIYLIPGDPGYNRSSDEKLRRDFYHKFNFKRMEKSPYWRN